MLDVKILRFTQYIQMQLYAKCGVGKWCNMHYNITRKQKDKTKDQTVPSEKGRKTDRRKRKLLKRYLKKQEPAERLIRSKATGA